MHFLTFQNPSIIFINHIDKLSALPYIQKKLAGKSMKNKFLSLIFLISLILTGCNAAINLGGKVAGISHGKFFYQDGNIIGEYKYDIDLVWKASEKSIADLKATDIQKERKISTGVIKAVIQEEKTVIKVEYLDKNLTCVSVFVGSLGNKMVSRLIHNRINRYLAQI